MKIKKERQKQLCVCDATDELYLYSQAFFAFRKLKQMQKLLKTYFWGSLPNALVLFVYKIVNFYTKINYKSD